MKKEKIIDFVGEVQLPEKYYETCITCNIINYFKENRGEIVYPFSVSSVREREEGYDFGYGISNQIFLLQYKRPKKIGNGYRWDIDNEQLDVIINNMYGNVTYYALPQFEDYKLWYDALNDDNTRFVDVGTLKKYMEKTGRKSINSTCDVLKGWEQVVYELFRGHSYKSMLEATCIDYKKELGALLQMEGVIGYEYE